MVGMGKDGEWGWMVMAMAMMDHTCDSSRDGMACIDSGSKNWPTVAIGYLTIYASQEGHMQHATCHMHMRMHMLYMLYTMVHDILAMAAPME